MAKVEIITIGDELLIGQVVDTNSAWMAQQLDNALLPVEWITSIHDTTAEIREAIRIAMQRVDIVLLTGGLGPTKDDITKTTLCDIFNTQLVHSQSVEDNIRRLWYNRNRSVLNELTATQALVPANCEVIQNEVGTAPVMLWKKGKKTLISMPGVPYEMKHAMTNHVIPRLLSDYPHQAIRVHRTVIVEGVAESALALRLNDWETALPDYMHLAYLPQSGLVRLRLDAVSDTLTEEQLQQQVGEQVKALAQIIGNDIVSYFDESLEVTLGRLLKVAHQTIATAESCTGGTIASLLAKHAGSSEFYKGSVVSYSNEVKHNVLGVKAEDLEQYGAVSEPVVRQMAEHVRTLMATDWAVATSGIAGPDGGTDEKPVGTIWIAVSGPRGTEARCLHLGTLREQNIQRTAQAVMAMAIRKIFAQVK